MTYRWFRYIRHADREHAEAEGWRFSADLAHHSAYSVLMEMPMPHAPQPPASPVPSPAERFAEAIAAMDQAHKSGVAVEIAFARRQLAEVSWNLADAIVAGLRTQVQARQQACQASDI